MPCQTLIASILHKYVSGRFAEKTQVVTAVVAERLPTPGKRTGTKSGV